MQSQLEQGSCDIQDKENIAWQNRGVFS